MPARVIINADDLGVSELVNDTIFSLMAERRVSSATILANGAAFEDAVRRARRFPEASFGVHLNVTEFRPLTRSKELSELLDSDGAFRGAAHLRKAKSKRRLRLEITAEWRAQISRVRSAGIHVSHLDSHHHAHTLPFLFPALKQLQREFGIRKVRRTKNLYTSRNQPAWRLLLGKVLWNIALQVWYATRTTRIFTSFEDFLQIAPARLAKHASFELMVHPGTERFAQETRSLSTPWREYLGFPTQLISFEAL